jgi:putative flippase GtrA
MVMLAPPVNPEIRRQIVGFVLAGWVSVVVEYGLFLLLFYGIHVPLLPASAAALMAALTVNFALNRRMVFHAVSRRYEPLAGQSLLFVGLAVINLLLTTWLISFLVTWLSPAMAKLAVMAASGLWNYVAYRELIFAKRRLGRSPNPSPLR